MIFPLSSFDVPEVLKVQVTPSEEVRVVVSLLVVVVLSLVVDVIIE